MSADASTTDEPPAAGQEQGRFGQAWAIDARVVSPAARQKHGAGGPRGRRLLGAVRRHRRTPSHARGCAGLFGQHAPRGLGRDRRGTSRHHRPQRRDAGDGRQNGFGFRGAGQGRRQGRGRRASHRRSARPQRPRTARQAEQAAGVRLDQARDHAAPAGRGASPRHSGRRLHAREQARLPERRRGGACSRLRQHRQRRHRGHREVYRRARAAGPDRRGVCDRRGEPSTHPALARSAGSARVARRTRERRRQVQGQGRRRRRHGRQHRRGDRRSSRCPTSTPTIRSTRSKRTGSTGSTSACSRWARPSRR